MKMLNVKIEEKTLIKMFVDELDKYDLDNRTYHKIACIIENMIYDKVFENEEIDIEDIVDNIVETLDN